MGLLSNLRARFERAGIRPNVTITPKLTPSLPRGPAIELPKIPRRRIGLPPRNISRIREDVGGIIERSLPVGESIPFVPPTIQPDPMPAPMPISPPVLGKPIMQQPRPQPIGVPSLMDPRQPQPNLATGIIDPVSQPIQQLPQGPQPIPQVPIELETGPVTIGGPKNLGVGPVPVLADNNPPTRFATIQPVQPIFTTDEPIDPANLRVSGPVPMPSLADLSMPKITTPEGPPLAQVTLGSGITPEGRDPFQKMPLPPKRS